MRDFNEKVGCAGSPARKRLARRGRITGNFLQLWRVSAELTCEFRPNRRLRRLNSLRSEQGTLQIRAAIGGERSGNAHLRTGNDPDLLLHR